MDVNEIKPVLRSILLSLGSSATEREFRKAYAEIEGSSFNEVLRNLNLNFYQMMTRIPDVCRVNYNFDGELTLHRISTVEAEHMDKLTVVKRKRPRKIGRPFMRFPGSCRSSVAYPTTNRGYGTSGFQRSRPVQPIYQRRPVQTFSRPIIVPASSRTPHFVPRPTPQKVINSLGSERVVYKPNETVIFDGKEVQVQRKSSLTKTDAVSVKPSDIASENNATSRSERVIYKPNERVIFDGQEVQVQRKDMHTWSDVISVKSSENEAISVKSSESAANLNIRGGAQSVPTTKPNIQEILKKYKILQLSKEGEKFTKSDNSKNDILSSVKVTVGNPPPPPILSAFTATTSSAENENKPPPNVLRTLMAQQHRCRARIFGNAIENIRKEVQEITKKALAEREIPVKPTTIPAADDYLQSFITDVNFRIPLPEMTDKPRFFNIKLLDVSSPTKFTFQFNSEALTALSAKIKELYESLENQIFYRVKIISSGMIVAAKHRSKWFRAQVVSASQEGALVVPLDCMTLEPKMIELHNIFYLHKSFATETQKSAIGQLYGIMPIEKEKVTQSNEEFKKISRNGTAIVKKLKDNVYFLNIVDPNAQANLVDLLRAKNLAVLDLQNLMQDKDDFLYVALK